MNKALSTCELIRLDVPMSIGILRSSQSAASKTPSARVVASPTRTPGQASTHPSSVTAPQRRLGLPGAVVAHEHHLQQANGRGPGRPANLLRHRRASDPGWPHLPASDIRCLAASWTSHGIVELEPGDAAITAALRARLVADSALICIASDAAAAGYLRRTRSGLKILLGDATDLRRLLTTAGVAHADLVIGTLRHVLTADTIQRHLIAGVADVLHPDGRFVVVVPSPVRSHPAIQRLSRRLNQAFTEVTHTAATWHHAAPAFLLVARNPTSSAAQSCRGVHSPAMHTDLPAAA